MSLSDRDFNFLVDTIKHHSGISLSKDREYLIESRLIPIAKKHNLSDLNSLVSHLKESNDESFIVEIIEAMTTNESLFFRDDKPFKFLTELVLPEIISKKGKDNEIKIWSAACSTGQEPYSIAMSMLEDPKLTNTNFSIFATDIDSLVLDKAKAGLYSQFEVQRGVPISLLLKYFTQEGESWRIKNELKEKVTFDKFNLIEGTSSFDKFDIIFCRNVLIYFDRATKERVLSNLCSTLNKDSFVFLGSSENILEIESNLKPLIKKGTQEIIPGLFHFDKKNT